MVLLVVYLFLITLTFVFTRHIANFYIFLNKKPFINNTYSEFIANKHIKNEFIYNKDNSFTCVLKVTGYEYHKENDLKKTVNKCLYIKQRAFNIISLKKSVDIKFVFKRIKEQDSYLNINYIEITSLDKTFLEEFVNSLKNSLHEFNVNLLKNKELLELLNLQTNLFHQEFNYENNKDIPVNDLLSLSSVRFDDDYGTLSNLYLGENIKQKHFKCLSFNFIGNELNNKYFQEISKANIEFDFIINTRFLDRFAQESYLKDSKKAQAVSSETSHKATDKQQEQLKSAEEILLNEEANLTYTDVFIIVFAPSLVELNKSINQIKQITSRHELNLVEETKLLNFFFLQRLIGFRLNQTPKFEVASNLLTYAKTILSTSLVGMFDYIDTPKGLTKTDWGNKPIASFKTHYNSHYNFNFHISSADASVGHGALIAPTGAGKTTIMQYLVKGILENYKNEVDIYLFDRYNGMKIFTQWQGGKNIDFDFSKEENREKTALNPLLINLKDNENFEFLQNLIEIMGKAESEEDKEEINMFVKAISELDNKYKTIEFLLQQPLFQPNSNVKANLNIYKDGKFKNYFNSKEDNFTLDNQLITMQMDKVLEHDELAVPIIYYIMFKIRQKARRTGRPHFIFLDESAKLLKNHYFKTQTEVLLQEHRKLRGVVWLAFQQANSFLQDSSLKELILGQCKNLLLLEEKGNVTEESILSKLNIDKELYNQSQQAKKYHNNPYFSILQRPSENLILDLNLKDRLGSDLKFLSSSAKDVLKMEQLIKEYGDEWVKYF